MEPKDLPSVTKIHTEAFPRQTLSMEWVSCNFKAFPRIRYYLAEIDGETVAYVHWTEKAGFRKEVVLEMEQIAVLSNRQNQGVGTKLILESLKMINQELSDRQASIKHILVSTRTDNNAQELYKKILNAKPEAIIPSLFSSDEVLMISRDIKIGDGS